MQLYPLLKAHPREAFLEWIFPSGAKVKFAHLEHEKNVYDWQGSQIPLIGFDELTHFSAAQFWYLISRNRSTSGVPGYIRATCNPDVNSWVRQLIDWWIDKEGYPIQERSGILRWFIRRDDTLVWGNSRQELLDKYGADELPKSLTFVPSSVHDNKILLEKDPSYLANLRALSRVERLRLLGGNWNVRASAGMLFQREWFPIVDTIPGGWIQAIRFWDRAACLIADTQVRTDKGLKPIQSLTTKDKVLTRTGFCEVAWAGISKLSDELVTVIFSDGKAVTGTKDHPVWTRNKGWVWLSLLTGEDIAYTEPKNTSIGTAVQGIIERFIGMFTSSTKGPYPRAIIYTIRTGTKLTTKSKILSVYREKNTPVFIKKICRLKLASKIIYTEQKHIKLFSKKSNLKLSRHALHVAANSTLKVLRRNIAACSVLSLKDTYAKLVGLFLTQEDSIRYSVVYRARTEGVPVYDLTVPKSPEFFANGILVHNTKPNEVNKDPDWTRGLKIYKYPNGKFLVADLKSMRDTPGQVENLIKNVATHDGQAVRIMSQQDPGSAGVFEAEHFVRMLAGFDVRTMTTSKDKITRAKPVSAQAEVGNIQVLKAAWNEDFFTEIENFSEDGAGHDDIVDVLSGAFNEMCEGFSIMDVL